MPIIEFDTKMRGYDPQQVNDAVTNFQDTINKYAQANTDLKRTLDTVNNQFTQANQDIDQLQAENKKLSERIEELEVVPEFLRTLVFARPRGDDQFADCTFSPSLDMSR